MEVSVVKVRSLPVKLGPTVPNLQASSVPQRTEAVDSCDGRVRATLPGHGALDLGERLGEQWHPDRLRPTATRYASVRPQDGELLLARHFCVTRDAPIQPPATLPSGPIEGSNIFLSARNANPTR